MESHNEMEKRHEKEFSESGIKFAFGNSQFEEMMKEWNLTTNEEDLKKIVSIGYGGYIQKKDLKAFMEMNKRHREEEKKLRKNKKELKKIIYHEMANHEFCITYDDEEVINAIGLTDEEKTEEFYNIYNQVRKQYLKENA